VNKTESFGIVQNLPFDVYRQLPGLNQSTLKHWLSTASNQSDTYKNLEAMQFGSAGHCLLLEPGKFEDLYVSAPKGLQQRGKHGKERWAEFCEKHIGKTVLKANEWDRLQNIRQIFQIHPQIKKFWDSGKTEVSLFWQDHEFSLDCKARLDWFEQDSGKIVDLKFTNNVGKVSLQKPIQDYYLIQAAWYSRGVYQLTKKTTDFIFVFIEKYVPHIIRVVQVSSDDLKNGLQKIECAIKNISNAKRDE